MVDHAEAARVTLDRHVVGRVGEDHGGTFLAHQRREGSGIKGVAAQDAMAAEEPQIADLAQRRPRRRFGHVVARIVSRVGHVVECSDPQVDLAHLEPDDLDVEIQPREREVLELLRQQPIVPGRVLAEPVVSDHEGADLGWGQMIEGERWHLGPAELAAGEQSAVPADHLVVAIGQDRNVEPEGLDAVGDLPDLLFAVEPRVRGVQLQFFDRPVDHVQKLGSRWFGADT